MQLRRAAIAAVALGVLAGCGSTHAANPSATSDPASEVVSGATDAYTPPVEPTTDPAPATSAAAERTCATWLATAAAQQNQLSKRYTRKYASDLELPGGTAGVLREAITSTCRLVPSTTPLDEIARRSADFLRNNRVDAP